MSSLICPACQCQTSDNDETCPNCGYNFHNPSIIRSVNTSYNPTSIREQRRPHYSRFIFIAIFAVIIAGIGLGVYYFLNRADEHTLSTDEVSIKGYTSPIKLGMSLDEFQKDYNAELINHMGYSNVYEIHDIDTLTVRFIDNKIAFITFENNDCLVKQGALIGKSYDEIIEILGQPDDFSDSKLILLYGYDSKGNSCKLSDDKSITAYYIFLMNNVAYGVHVQTVNHNDDSGIVTPAASEQVAEDTPAVSVEPRPINSSNPVAATLSPDEVYVPGHDMPLKLGMSFDDIQNQYDLEKSNSIFTIKDINIRLLFTKENKLRAIAFNNQESIIQNGITVGVKRDDVIKLMGNPVIDNNRMSMAYYYDSNMQKQTEFDNNTQYQLVYYYKDDLITAIIISYIT